ncbi:MAG: hypothetical protein M1405_03255 [Patescibacteria group bacterium]|nr:hypothetical protein [Patescibacteria group bacterium]
MKELKPIEETWNKKRIFFWLTFLIMLVAGLITFKVLALDKNQDFSQKPITNKTKSVEGTSSRSNSSNQDNPAVNLKTSVADQLNSIKQEASSINIAEVATSSPQVQKVLEDIKSIQNLPKSQAKSFCQQICNGL